MDKISFGSTNLKVTKIAIGGIPLMRLEKKDAAKLIKEILEIGVNFIDTANSYGDSEEKIGLGIKGFKRDQLVLASKSAESDKKTFISHVDCSLKRLKTDYIDIYHLHYVNTQEQVNKVMAEGGAFEGLEEVIKKGKVRYFAFSSHSLSIAKNLILSDKFQVVQIPFNFIDSEAIDEIIPLARGKNMGIICMKPLGGGLIDNANLAFRYLSQFDGIVPDPGIEKLEEIKEIVKIINDPRPLSLAEEIKIEKIRKESEKKWCHRCDYCRPCPQGIEISSILFLKSSIKRLPFKEAVEWLDSAVYNGKNCEDCKKCVQKCPYDLDIPEMLKENISFWEDYKKQRK